jgi:hypothetical protein
LLVALLSLSARCLLRTAPGMKHRHHDAREGEGGGGGGHSGGHSGGGGGGHGGGGVHKKRKSALSLSAFAAAKGSTYDKRARQEKERNLNAKKARVYACRRL